MTAAIDIDSSIFRDNKAQNKNKIIFVMMYFCILTIGIDFTSFEHFPQNMRQLLYTLNRGGADNHADSRLMAHIGLHGNELQRSLLLYESFLTNTTNTTGLYILSAIGNLIKMISQGKNVFVNTLIYLL